MRWHSLEITLCCELSQHNACVHSIWQGPDAKSSRTSAFWFFLSTTMVFAVVPTHFPRKNTHVYHNTVTCITRVTLNQVEVHCLNLQHLAMVRASNIADLVPSGIFCLQPWFLQRSEHISPRKTPMYMMRSLKSCLSIEMNI